MPSLFEAIKPVFENIGVLFVKMLDKTIPPEQRVEIMSKVHDFAMGNPKLASFLFIQAILTGLPILFFLLFTLATLFSSLAAVLLTEFFTAIVLTFFVLNVALLVLLPTVVLTTCLATAVFLGGLGVYSALTWATGNTYNNAPTDGAPNAWTAWLANGQNKTNASNASNWASGWVNQSELSKAASSSGCVDAWGHVRDGTQTILFPTTNTQVKTSTSGHYSTSGASEANATVQPGLLGKPSTTSKDSVFGGLFSTVLPFSTVPVTKEKAIAEKKPTSIFSSALASKENANGNAKALSNLFGTIPASKETTKAQPFVNRILAPTTANNENTNSSGGSGSSAGLNTVQNTTAGAGTAGTWKPDVTRSTTTTTTTSTTAIAPASSSTAPQAGSPPSKRAHRRQSGPDIFIKKASNAPHRAPTSE